MANICIGTVVFHGANVVVLYDAISNASDEDVKATLDKIAEAVEMKMVGDPRYYMELVEYDPAQELLKVEAELAWGDNREYFDALAKHLGLSWNGWFDTDGATWKVVNDKKHTDDFPGGVIIDTYGEDNSYNLGEIYETFSTAEEAAAYLNKESGSDMSFEEWQEAFDDEDIGRLELVEDAA